MKVFIAAAIEIALINSYFNRITFTVDFIIMAAIVIITVTIVTEK